MAMFSHRQGRRRQCMSRKINSSGAATYIVAADRRVAAAMAARRSGSPCDSV